MIQMQALWLENQRLTYRAVIPTPVPQPDEALIKIHQAGICGTDLELLRGYYPYGGVPGHEFIGEVVKTTDPSWLGERVVGEINIPCGECSECTQKRPMHCERRRVLGIKNYPGVFTDYITLPLANLHRVPAVVPDDEAVFVEPLAAALEIQEQVKITPSQRVLLIGAGRLGLLIAQTLFLTGCDLRVAVKHSKAREILGRMRIPVIEPDNLPSRAMDVVIEASGSPDGFHAARQAVHPRGILVLKSTYAGSTQVNLSSLVVDEVTLIGSRCGPFPKALQLLESGQVKPSSLIEARYPLSEGLEAFAMAARPGTLKVLLHP